MFRFENFCIQLSAILWIEWDADHPDKGVAFKMVSAPEPLIISGPQGVRCRAEIDRLWPDMLAAERGAKLPKDFRIERGAIPIRPLS